MACDIQCQRNKKLDSLHEIFHEATLRKGIDPEAYEQARINYYTVKDGQGWLAKEKERIANETVEPILDSYKSRFGLIQKSIDKQNAKQQAMKDVENSQVGDEDDVRFIHSMLKRERDKAGVHKRLLELNPDSTETYSWLPIFLDVLIGLLVLFVAYRLWTRFTTQNPNTF